jgi:hypothetical protein
MSITFSDPDHSKEEDRYITIGWSNRARLIMVSHTDRNKRIRIISARELTQSERKSNEEKTTEINDELRPEYDLKSLLKDGVHGKYTQTFRAWTNLILLKPDVAKAFPDEKAVNEALRLVMKLTKVQKDARPGARQ